MMFCISMLTSLRMDGHKVREVGQLRRAKLHAACLIEDIDNKGALTPALRELLEASLTLGTTSSKILAAHLQRTPATIRAELQRILMIIGDRGDYSALHTTKTKDFFVSRVK